MKKTNKEKLIDCLSEIGVEYKLCKNNFHDFLTVYDTKGDNIYLEFHFNLDGAVKWIQ